MWSAVAYAWRLCWWNAAKSTGHIGCFWCELCTTGTYVKWGILGVQFYIYVAQFMCGQIQQNIQGIWCEFGRVFLLTYCTFQFMCGQIQQNIQGIWCEFGRVFLLIYIVHFMCLSNAAKTTGHMVLWCCDFLCNIFCRCLFVCFLLFF